MRDAGAEALPAFVAGFSFGIVAGWDMAVTGKAGVAGRSPSTYALLALRGQLCAEHAAEFARGIGAVADLERKIAEAAQEPESLATVPRG
jgi:hypothetical protein